MFAHEFMRNALIAGSFVGLACGLVGYFVVLRAQVFAGDALSHVAFTGGLAAAVLGLSVAETSQITGALLVFALLVTPAATAHRLTPRPGLGIALSVAIALAVTWLGLALAYFSVYPVGFYVTSLSFAVYLLVRFAQA